MTHYYNEFNPESAAMLRQMMADGLIPEGIVDERSITEVTADELRQYTQCHFFAGIAGWQFALQLANWPSDQPVWTGSCPCQPFSSAGQRKGKSDDRHLWPVWERLIRECRPAAVFGEQITSAIAEGWLDDVYQGLEAEGYAVGAFDLPACSVGKATKRERVWFVAYSGGDRWIERWKCQSAPASHGSKRDSGTVEGHWEMCPDKRKRLFKPGIRLLVDGFLDRRPILHAIGNAIVPQVAAEFIKAAM